MEYAPDLFRLDREQDGAPKLLASLECPLEHGEPLDRILWIIGNQQHDEGVVTEAERTATGALLQGPESVEVESLSQWLNGHSERRGCQLRDLRAVRSEPAEPPRSKVLLPRPQCGGPIGAVGTKAHLLSIQISEELRL